MKLIIQIPCYNEEQNIEKTIQDLPHYIEGIDEIEYLAINDGSTDDTLNILKRLSVHHIVNLHSRQGLAKAFSTGIDECLKNGADIIVNTDGDNQYPGKNIKKLVIPIINNQADIVIGQRDLKGFSFLKRFFQKLGSFIVRVISGTKVKDAPCGFRAYSREAAMHINITSNFTYTLESIIQASADNQVITNVPIVPNIDTRPSRLFKNMFQYIRKSMFTIIKSFIIYKPFTFFNILGVLFFFLSLIMISINIALFIILIFLSFFAFMFSFLSVNYVANRKMLENMNYNIKKSMYKENIGAKN